MASIYRLLRKGKAFAPQGKGRMLELASRAAAPPECMLVSLEAVARDVVSGAGDVAEAWSDVSSMPITPPHRRMWIEWPGQMAGLASRVESEHGFEVLILFFVEAVLPREAPQAALIADMVLLLRPDGSLVNPSEVTVGSYLEGAGDATAEGRCVEFSVICAHALARMNCRNVKLEPIDGPKLVPYHQTKPIPASVWHKIVISDEPKSQTTGRNGLGRDEQLIRSHWVRGHYADYRENGLFGRAQSRGIYWIPEHRRGNEELGQVIPEYVVQ